MISTSVIVLTFNAEKWLEKCVESIRSQTVLDELQLIIADNGSTDRTQEIATRLVQTFPVATWHPFGRNYGYCQGNNLATAGAVGEWLFFLNQDAWLEPDCIEHLQRVVALLKAEAACPAVMNYNDDSHQSSGASGMDVFGLTTSREKVDATEWVFMPEGCAYLIRTDVFTKLGGFDPFLFMYSDEHDLSWRLWLAGYEAITVPSAKVHHRQ